MWMFLTIVSARSIVLQKEITPFGKSNKQVGPPSQPMHRASPLNTFNLIPADSRALRVSGNPLIMIHSLGTMVRILPLSVPLALYSLKGNLMKLKPMSCING